MWPICMSNAPLSCHTISGNNGGGVDINRDVTVDNRWAVESAKEDWQNGKTYESYERSYIKLEKS